MDFFKRNLSGKENNLQSWKLGLQYDGHGGVRVGGGAIHFCLLLLTSRQKEASSCSECYYQAAVNIKLSAGTRERVTGKEDQWSEVPAISAGSPDSPRTGRSPRMWSRPPSWNQDNSRHARMATHPVPLISLRKPPIRVFYTLLGRQIKAFKDGPKQSLHYGPPLPPANGKPESVYPSPLGVGCDPFRAQQLRKGSKCGSRHTLLDEEWKKDQETFHASFPSSKVCQFWS